MVALPLPENDVAHNLSISQFEEYSVSDLTIGGDVVKMQTHASYLGTYC